MFQFSNYYGDVVTSNEHLFPFQEKKNYLDDFLPVKIVDVTAMPEFMAINSFFSFLFLVLGNVHTPSTFVPVILYICFYPMCVPHACYR